MNSRPWPITLVTSLSLLICATSAGQQLVASPGLSGATRSANLSMPRVFDENVIAIGRTPSESETNEVRLALKEFLGEGTKSPSVGRIVKFVEANATSPWSPSLQFNLGRYFKWNGQFSKALDAFDNSWDQAKGFESSEGQGIADRALAELIELRVMLGHLEETKNLVLEGRTRTRQGALADSMSLAESAIAVMEKAPWEAFRCGPSALMSVLKAKGQNPYHPKMYAPKPGPKGSSLTENLEWSRDWGMQLQAAKREPGATILTPAVVHWKSGHFSAVIKQEKGRLLVQDPVFMNERWIPAETLEEEGSGYSLVAKGTLPPGWSLVTESEAGNVWGRGYTSRFKRRKQKPKCSGNGGLGGDDRNSDGTMPTDSRGIPLQGEAGMATYSASIPYIGLVLHDTPLRYTPPRGSPVAFSLGYFQWDSEFSQPGNFTNLGPRWSLSWQRYIKDDPATPGQTATLVGGMTTAMDFTGFDTSTQTYAVQPYSHEQLVKTGPASYELRRGKWLEASFQFVGWINNLSPKNFHDANNRSQWEHRDDSVRCAAADHLGH